MSPGFRTSNLSTENYRMRFAFLLAGAAVMAAPLSAQDYHFTRQLAAGQELRIDNINGAVDVSRAAGRVAEVSITKTVKRGNGALVKAIMEDGGSGMRVCTIYLNRDPNRNSCAGSNNTSDNDHGDKLDVEMHYTVRLPAGAQLRVEDVNGSVNVVDGDADAQISTVNGSIDFTGVAASKLETVNGHIKAVISRGTWAGTMKLSTVNGGVDVTLPANTNAELHGSSVNGGLTTGGFPVTISKGWGPKSLDGHIGSGGGKLDLETVNGGINIHKG